VASTFISLPSLASQGPIDVIINPINDAIRISDGTNSMAVEPDGSINTNSTLAPGSKVQITDGVDDVLVSTAGELQVKDDAAAALLADIDTNTSNIDVALSTIASEATLSALNSKFVGGTDIGDVTINNTGGASAVNIQDGGNSITVDGTFWQAVQPVSGPLTDAELRASAVPVSATSLPLPTGASTAALQSDGNSSLSSIDSKLTSPLTITGALTDAQLRASPVPVSGTVTANIGTISGISTEATLSALNAKVTAVDTGAVVVSSSALPTGAATAALQTQPGVDIGDVTVNNAAGASAVNIQDGGNSITVDGTFWQATQPVSGPLTDAELRASAVPVSVASIPLPTGAATSALQTTGNASLSSIDSKLTAPLSVTGPLTDTQLRNSPVPVSGTVTANIGTISGISTEVTLAALNAKVTAVDTGAVVVSSSALPTGAATAALQTQPGVDIGDVTVNNTGGASAVNIQDGGNSITVDGTFWQAVQPVSGTVTANAGTDLNTSLLALDSTVAKDSSLSTLDVSVNTLLKPASTLAAVTTVGTVSSVTAIANALPAGTNSIGQVTANAGTNLNTSLLALETTQVTQNTRIGDLTETAPANDTASSGLNGRLQRIAQRLTSLITTTTDRTQKTQLTNGTIDVAATSGVAGLSDVGIVVRPLPHEPQSYSASGSAFVPATTATDVYLISGSASKTVRIHKIRISGTTTSGSPIKCTIRLIKRSTANTAGTAVISTIVPHDSTNAAATAVAKHYTANPTVGASAGDIRAVTNSFQAAGLTVGSIEFNFDNDGGQPVILRGVAENLAVNLNSTTVTGGVLSVSVEWSEV